MPTTGAGIAAGFAGAACIGAALICPVAFAFTQALIAANSFGVPGISPCTPLACSAAARAVKPDSALHCSTTVTEGCEDAPLSTQPAKANHHQQGQATHQNFLSAGAIFFNEIPPSASVVSGAVCTGR